MKTGVLFKRARGQSSFTLLKPWTKRTCSLSFQDGLFKYCEEKNGYVCRKLLKLSFFQFIFLIVYLCTCCRKLTEKGVVHCRGCAVKIIDESTMGRPFAFEVSTKDGSEGCLVLAATSSSDRDDWMLAFRRAALPVDNTPPEIVQTASKPRTEVIGADRNARDRVDQPQPPSSKYAMDDIDDAPYVHVPEYDFNQNGEENGNASNYVGSPTVQPDALHGEQRSVDSKRNMDYSTERKSAHHISSPASVQGDDTRSHAESTRSRVSVFISPKEKPPESAARRESTSSDWWEPSAPSSKSISSSDGSLFINVFNYSDIQ